MRTLFLSVVLSALPAMAGLISNPTAGIFDGFTNAVRIEGQMNGTRMELFLRERKDMTPAIREERRKYSWAAYAEALERLVARLNG